MNSKFWIFFLSAIIAICLSSLISSPAYWKLLAFYWMASKLTSLWFLKSGCTCYKANPFYLTASKLISMLVLFSSERWIRARPFCCTAIRQINWSCWRSQEACWINRPSRDTAQSTTSKDSFRVWEAYWKDWGFCFMAARTTRFWDLNFSSSFCKLLPCFWTSCITMSMSFYMLSGNKL